MSSAHLQRLNKIHQRFQRSDDHQLAQIQSAAGKGGPQVNNFMGAPSLPQNNWLNTKRYESPVQHTYPKNPFSTDRNQQVIINQ